MPCPMCENEMDEKYRPFCSKRCADLDLAKWLNGSYAVPSQDPDDFEDLSEALEKAQDKDDEPPFSKPH
ncbi:DNA gyrase inhibitor YacG [Nereida sp. MMG025]|uniref:DNA gyrase inhibitor YacG n=1 Tax=Nereida sp. MMG025 TaxID=2909981 RepID=UPI001F22F688|nr:DNA gyrase inhibitor YacG [Nereida sp. MMG025]MCF6443980.1 DNA gyrase inhibitor YacG [Nereida sp. MMG025]